MVDDFEALKRVIQSRRSVRVFMPEPVPQDVLDAMVRLVDRIDTSYRL